MEGCSVIWVQSVLGWPLSVLCLCLRCVFFWFVPRSGQSECVIYSISPLRKSSVVTYLRDVVFMKAYWAMGWWSESFGVNWGHWFSLKWWSIISTSCLSFIQGPGLINKPLLCLWTDIYYFHLFSFFHQYLLIRHLLFGYLRVVFSCNQQITQWPSN